MSEEESGTEMPYHILSALSCLICPWRITEPCLMTHFGYCDMISLKVSAAAHFSWSRAFVPVRQQSFKGLQDIKSTLIFLSLFCNTDYAFPTRKQLPRAELPRVRQSVNRQSVCLINRF